MKTAFNKGFTLLEVMISVSIIALVFTSFFKMQSGTIELATACKFDTIAPILAKQLFVKIEQDIAGWSKTEGGFGENFPGIRWTCKISNSSFQNLNFISEANKDHLKKIEMEITDSSRLRSYKINTWRYSIE